MITEAQLAEVITKAKEGSKKRKFKQSIELIISSIDCLNFLFLDSVLTLVINSANWLSVIITNNFEKTYLKSFRAGNFY